MFICEMNEFEINEHDNFVEQLTVSDVLIQKW